jgi:hypothetical protein
LSSRAYEVIRQTARGKYVYGKDLVLADEDGAEITLSVDTPDLMDEAKSWLRIRGWTGRRRCREAWVKIKAALETGLGLVFTAEAVMRRAS